MIEIPEALTLAGQINNTIKRKQIVNVIAAYTPQKYHEMLVGKTINTATAYGGMVEINADNTSILIGDGVAFRYREKGEKRPAKHQLLLEFNDSSGVSASIQMYGGIWCFNTDEGFQNLYYKITKEKPSPLSYEFNEAYFNELISAQSVQKLSTKAFLATEQRIPGLGNGVLQDIMEG